ncbi:MAG TPA: DUF167 domain-containing protein [Candidatus Saccharimonadales bacterium]|nr:DUF167 domain-containing protein [Candidatus Saccharimonadales bacterium]
MSLLVVRVKPGSKKGPLVQPGLDGSLLVYVREPAVDGKANQAVVGLLADYLGVSKSQVQMVSGKTSRLKHFKIS